MIIDHQEVPVEEEICLVYLRVRVLIPSKVPSFPLYCQSIASANLHMKEKFCPLTITIMKGLTLNF